MEDETRVPADRRGTNESTSTGPRGDWGAAVSGTNQPSPARPAFHIHPVPARDADAGDAMDPALASSGINNENPVAWRMCRRDVPICFVHGGGRTDQLIGAVASLAVVKLKRIQ